MSAARISGTKLPSCRPPAPPKPRYTLGEQDARAEARGLTYGQLVNLENNGLPLPPLRRSVQWPWDSPHRGEEQI